MQQVFITGANRGIGLELVRRYAQRGDQVFAGVRNPDNADQLLDLCLNYPQKITVLQIDVTDQSTIDAASESVRSSVPALDVLINNAGIYLRGDRPGTLNRDQFRETFEVNVISPAMVTQSFLPLLRAGSKVVNISSNMGSLANPAGGSYSYRISKTAVNKLSRVLASDLAAQQIIVIAMNPGWVLTDMGGEGAEITVEESASGIISVVDSLTMQDSGSFYRYDGQHNPW